MLEGVNTRVYVASIYKERVKVQCDFSDKFAKWLKVNKFILKGVNDNGYIEFVRGGIEVTLT